MREPERTLPKAGDVLGISGQEWAWPCGKKQRTLYTEFQHEDGHAAIPVSSGVQVPSAWHQKQTCKAAVCPADDQIAIESCHYTSCAEQLCGQAEASGATTSKQVTREWPEEEANAEQPNTQIKLRARSSLAVCLSRSELCCVFAMSWSKTLQ